MQGINGFTKYRKREYCNDVKCPVQLIMNKKTEGSAEYNELRELCQKNCLHTTHEFHKWLIEKGFLLVKPENVERKMKSELLRPKGRKF